MIRSFAKRLVSQRSAILALTLTAEICLPITLQVSAPDAWLSLLLPASILGVLGGFAFQQQGWKEPRASAMWLAAGMLVLFVRIGALGEAIRSSILQTCSLLLASLLRPEAPGADLASLAAWVSAQQELGNQIGTFALRASGWLAAMLQGAVSDDPAARALWLALGLWLLAVWASWRIAQRQDALGGMVPTTLALGLILTRIAYNGWALWLHLTAFLLLLAVTLLAKLLRDWEASRTDFADSITLDSATSAILVIMLILSSAYVVSAFSVKDLIDRLREKQQPIASAARDSGPGSYTAAGRGQGIHEQEEQALAIHPILAGPHLSQALVMYVSTGDLPPMQHAVDITVPHYYWEQANYQTYTGSGWVNQPAIEASSPSGTRFLPNSAPKYRYMQATVTLPAGTVGSAYWTGELIRTDQPLRVVWRAQPDLNAAQPGPEVLGGADMMAAFFDGEADGPQARYGFEAWLPAVDEEALNAAPAIYPTGVRDNYLQLPYDLPDRVRALARDLTAHEATPYGRAVAIESYLRKIPYSLDVPAPPQGRDAVDFFLFTLKRGYCDYYATSMAVLARAAGLPARLVTGYSSGSYDPYSAQYVVRAVNAHSWTEIYFSGIGWIEFEPTASQPAPARERFQVPLDITQELTTLKSPSTRLPLPAGRIRAIALLALALPMVLWCMWLGFDQWRLRRMEPAAATRQVYLRMRSACAGLGGTGPVGETALEYSDRIADTLAERANASPLLLSLVDPIPRMLSEVTRLHMRALFAPTPLSKADRRQAIRTWNRLRWRLALLHAGMALTRPSTLRASAPSTVPDGRAG